PRVPLSDAAGRGGAPRAVAPIRVEERGDRTRELRAVARDLRCAGTPQIGGERGDRFDVRSGDDRHADARRLEQVVATDRDERPADERDGRGSVAPRELAERVEEEDVGRSETIAVTGYGSRRSDV